MKLSEIPLLGAKFWKELGGKLPGLVKDDALKGLMQDNRQKLRYKSKEYMKYKANGMRRFTKGEGKTFSDKEGYFFGKTYFQNKKAGINKRTGFTTGNKLSAYRTAGSIESTQTQFVDLTVTGRMINSLSVKKADETSVTMGFAPDQAGKLLGNKRHGYNVIGLNDKNKLYVKNEIIKELKKRGEQLPKKIVINIGV